MKTFSSSIVLHDHTEFTFETHWGDIDVTTGKTLLASRYADPMPNSDIHVCEWATVAKSRFSEVSAIRTFFS